MGEKRLGSSSKDMQQYLATKKTKFKGFYLCSDELKDEKSSENFTTFIIQQGCINYDVLFKLYFIHHKVQNVYIGII